MDEFLKIVVLDVETTGKEKSTDQIIELCIQFGLGANAESRTWRIKPTIPIHPEAQAVHGISMEMLADCPTFDVALPEFLPLITEADIIVGYNVAFDLDMIQSELARAKIPPITFKRVVCALRLWHHAEPRTLVAAHAKFCGEEMVNAHQASADVAATARVFEAMRTTFGMTDKSWAEIAAVSDPFANRTTWIGPSMHIQWDERGCVIFAFGKYKGQQVSQADRGFLRWVIGKDFPPHVKKICEVAMERRQHFDDWIAQYYPRPTSKTVDLLNEALDPDTSDPDSFTSPQQALAL